jgi:membrane protein required for colicin V production
VNWVDIAIIAVIGLSGLLAFMRGLVREVMGIGAWVGAVMFAWWATPFVRERFHGWIANPDIADPAAAAAMFVVGLLFLSVVAGMIGSVVRGSVLSGVDRTLGVVFGFARGAALVVFAYIVAGMVVVPDKWPEPVLQARTLPSVYTGARWVACQIPEQYRPAVSRLPAGHDTTVVDLCQASPPGPVVGRP